MGWGNTLRRRLRVFAVALVIYFDYKAVQKRVEWVSRGKKNALWEKTHQRNAKRVLNLMIELEGLWVKLGQYLSTRADVLPEAYISLLKKLQDSLPPRPLKENLKLQSGALAIEAQKFISATRCSRSFRLLCLLNAQPEVAAAESRSRAWAKQEA